MNTANPDTCAYTAIVTDGDPNGIGPRIITLEAPVKLTREDRMDLEDRFAEHVLEDLFDPLEDDEDYKEELRRQINVTVVFRGEFQVVVDNRR